MSRLTDEQVMAAQHHDGHARVLAVAGAGKTTLLMARVTWLLDAGVSPERIRLLTYNKEAAIEIEHRLQRLGVSGVQTQTFHALGWRLLQRLMQQQQLPAYRLASRAQSQFLHREALRQTETDFDQLELLEQSMEWVKGQALPWDLALASLPSSMQSVLSALKRLEQLREQAGVWFFSDMLYAPWRLLQQSTVVSEAYANHIDHFLVDEYQDANPVQHALLQLLAGHRAKVMVVGDVDQCIYTWRGAAPALLATSFSQDFSPCTTYHLSRSFRFGHALALLANHAIAANPWADRAPVLSAEQHQGTSLSYVVGGDALQTVRVLNDWRGQGRSWPEMAILVRLWGQAAAVELGLLANRIPYRLLGERSVWHSNLMQGVMALLQLASGQLQLLPVEQREPLIEAFWSLPPMGVSSSVRQALVQSSLQSPLDVVSAISALPTDRTWLKQYWLRRGEWWQMLHQQQQKETNALALLQAFAQSCDCETRLQKLSGTPVLGEQQAALWRTLLSLMPSELTIPAAIEWLRAQQQQALSAHVDEDAVVVTTIHRVKGREWPCVVVAGLQDTAFPGSRSDNQPELVEEERRLFYVAITRAQHQLALILPEDDTLKMAWQQGRVLSHEGNTCRFVGEINWQVCQLVDAYLRGKQADLPKGVVDSVVIDRYLHALGLGVKLPPVERLQVANQVSHQRFGLGMILSQQEDRLEVAFADGVRWLKKDHAALSLVSMEEH